MWVKKWKNPSCAWKLLAWNPREGIEFTCGKLWLVFGRVWSRSGGATGLCSGEKMDMRFLDYNI
jgi:hypothetical protein